MTSFKLPITLICIFTCYACGNKNLPYQVKNDGGIFIEEYDSTNLSQNKYTEDNILYTEDLILEFDYTYINGNGDTLLYKSEKGKRPNEWVFVHKDSVDDKTITGYLLTVNYGQEGMFGVDSTYNQTVIEYKPVYNFKHYSKVKQCTGLIENDKNIWMHPNRDRLFRVTQLNPWPFIQKPFELGNTYGYSLKSGSNWGDERWRTWEGVVETVFNYEIKDKETIRLNENEYSCWVVEGTGISRLGETDLRAYFNESFGFIKLHYANIDSSQLIITLKDQITKGKSQK